jgi:hypothetical protein
MTVASGELSLAGWYRIDDFRHSDKRMPADKVHSHLGLIGVDGRPKPVYYAMRFAIRLFKQPLRVIGLRQRPHSDSQATGTMSQAEIHMLQRRDSGVIVAAWLRSSQYDEVRRHTGFEVDTRRERVSIELPCTAATVTSYNALGQKVSTTTPRSTQLSNVLLTGGRVYIAEVTCESESVIK